jgi:hypothetical protein
VTGSLVRVLGKKPEHIHIVIQEIAEEIWLNQQMQYDLGMQSSAARAGNSSRRHVARVATYEALTLFQAQG